MCFQPGGTGNLVAQGFRAAPSQPFDILGSGPGSANPTWNAPLRAGRYDLRACFENSSSSLSVSESTVLVLNYSSWVSLSGACPPGEAQATGISYTGSLASGEGSWPRTPYYLFRSSGVEALVLAWHFVG